MKLKYIFDGMDKPGCMSVGQVIMELDLGPEAEPHRGAVVIIPVCEQLIPNRKDGGVKPSMCSYSAQTY